MSKKHFIALADLFRRLRPSTGAQFVTAEMRFAQGERLAQWDYIMRETANLCAGFNPKFDRARWLGYIAGENGPNGGSAKRIGHKIADNVAAMERVK